jgi:nucleoside-diphosphate-sugar epimerase
MDLPTVFQERKKGDIQNSLADIGRIKEYLGYQVKVDFEQGIKDYIALMLDQKSST